MNVEEVFSLGIARGVSEQSFSELSSTSLVRISPKPLSGMNISVNIKRTERRFIDLHGLSSGVRLQALTGEANLHSPPPPSVTLCPFKLSSDQRVALQFTEGGGDAVSQLREAGGVARLDGVLLGTRGSLSRRQGGAPGFASGAWLLGWRALQHKQFAGGFVLGGLRVDWWGPGGWRWHWSARGRVRAGRGRQRQLLQGNQRSEWGWRLEPGEAGGVAGPRQAVTGLGPSVTGRQGGAPSLCPWAWLSGRRSDQWEERSVYIRCCNISTGGHHALTGLLLPLVFLFGAWTRKPSAHSFARRWFLIYMIRKEEELYSRHK